MTDIETKRPLASLLPLLHCPYCGSALELGGSRPNYGVVRCACHTYPVVDGIPILRQIDGLASVVERITAADPAGALNRALNLFRVTWARRTRWHQFLYRRACRRLTADPGLAFEDAVRLVRKPKGFGDYLFHRYANPSFLAAAGLLQVVGLAGGEDGGRQPRVLDLACGAGHSSFLLRHLFPRTSVFSADHDFVSLYLAKRFLAPGGVHLCLDAEVPSPFPAGFFDALYCLDAFHYLRPKTAVAAELRRVASPGAVWLFPHLHNALRPNVTPGVPLPPDGYLRCFESLGARLFDETRVLHELSERHVLDLTCEAPASRLADAQALVLIAGPDSLWQQHQGFPANLCRDAAALAINPIYRQTPVGRDGDEVQLTLRWPNGLMGHECSGALAVLPRECRISLGALRRAQRGGGGGGPAGDDRLAELVSRFVLVPLPPAYCAASVTRAPGDGRRASADGGLVRPLGAWAR